jgi:tetratricopeptide (TPR) repeat protein
MVGVRWVLGAALCVSIDVPAARSQDPTSARKHAEKAAEYVQAADFAHAEAELLAAVRLAPTDASYLTSLGGVLGMQGKLSEANSYFERAVKSNPADATARRNLAANQWRLGQLKPAQANLERLVRQQPQDKASILLLGMVSENLRDYARAAKLLGSIPDLVNQRPETVAALASACYHTSQRDKAHQLLESLLGHAADPQSIFAAAGVAADAADYGIAEKLFDSIRSSYPDQTKLTYNLALIQYRTGRVAESQQALLMLTSSGHSNADVYDLLGQSYQMQGNTTEAIHALEAAIHQDPSNELHYVNLVTILIDAKRLPAALEAANKMTAEFPASASAFETLGRALLKVSQYTDAVRAYRRAVELVPSSLAAQIGLASAQWGSGMRTEGQSGFEALIQQYPRDASVYETYATLLLDSAPNTAAETRSAMLLKTALTLDATRAESHYRLGSLALKNQVNADALQHLETAARLAPRESKIQFALARLYRRLGRVSDATQAMRRYEELQAPE